MQTTRRGFVGTIALGAAAGALTGTSPFGKRASAQTREAAKSGIYDGGVIQLNQNESARGPGPKTIQAIQAHTNKRMGRGYSPDHVNELRTVVADYYEVGTDNVQLATGSTPLLQGSVRAFCSATRGFVTPMPTYSTSLSTARRIGARTAEVDLDSSLAIDLEALAEASRGAGLVYLCNPNNPTGTVHGPGAVERFVRRVLRESPDTMIHVDEAYINYARPGSIESAVPLALEDERVFVTRSFSKAHGIAGLRVGYGIAQEQTLARIRGAWGMGDVNMLGAIAAITAFEDREHIEWEVRENAEIRDGVIAAFRDMGFDVPDSNTNHIFVHIGRPAREFREACLERKVLVGRDFPPLHTTHCRISIGSREEMTAAMKVFKEILA